MASVIETHPQRQRIIDALLAGESPKKIAKWVNPYVSHVAIWRYQHNQVRPALAKPASIVKALEERGLLRPQDSAEIAAEAVKGIAQSVLAADPILARLAHRQAERDRIAGIAEQDGDLRTWSTLDRNDLAAVELHAKLTGRLNTATDARTVVIVVPPGSPQAQQATEDDGPVIDITPGE